ncbi:ATP-binding protein [Staphylococcus aureus]|uniref:ATP-binding protein n=1 Tax=Staphylococcus aureus TaxID=1280 RepID=UPI00215C51B2|nr:ATP-binding protein [Staphylococcus aureus]UVJ00258.1 ATP-binding protein [Staphylococcus aureus]
MKKKQIINLIRYHSENNEIGFKKEAFDIANSFERNGDAQLAEYIMSLLSDNNVFTPQMQSENFEYIKKMDISNKSLPLPDVIKEDIIGIVNAVGHNAGISKFLFEGDPGTGKTETVKQISRILDRELYYVDFDSLIDSKLGQTSKNVSNLFNELNSIVYPQNVVILFDEIDGIAMNRMNNSDIREMGRATTSLLKGLDSVNENLVIIGTTNLFKEFDKALIRRFDATINFNRYETQDLIEIALFIIDELVNVFKFTSRNKRLLKKILETAQTLPYPGDLNNILRTSVAFSNPNNEFDYIKKIFIRIIGKEYLTVEFLKSKKYTVREIEVLTGVSKSQVSRGMKEEKNDE